MIQGTPRDANSLSPVPSAARPSRTARRMLFSFLTVLQASSFIESVTIVPALLVIVCAAIDVDRLSGDEATILTDEEQAGRSDFVYGALPAERDPGGVRQVAVIPFRIVAPCIDAARRNNIDPDVMAGEFRGEPARHADQPHLRCR